MHQRIVYQGAWHDRGRVETDWVLEQDIGLDEGQALDAVTMTEGIEGIATLSSTANDLLEPMLSGRTL
ncbi:hypothetical protein [Azotobacter beijerinckii]|uniref:hypothetical protein n=1 Tax=Azotobacter beijerinckii TaxID=170623 RepID=UPI000B84E00E|nr:hypothetical protein [Azotobacter beijerinckii]